MPIALLLWGLTSMVLVACSALGSAFFHPSPTGLRLGTDWPIQVLEDPEGRLAPDDVEALPDAAFATLHTPLNAGYHRQVHWMRFAPPPIETPAHDPLWLEIHPTYLDSVTLYQRTPSGWQAHTSGDHTSMAQRLRLRQMVLPLTAGEPALLRVQTDSAMQLYGTVWRSTALMAQLAGTEWPLGVHQGINLLVAVLVVGAAMALRMRSLYALAVLSVIVLVHTSNVRGYAQLWFPDLPPLWGDLSVSMGVFALPAAFAWQGRELLTRGTRWRRIDHTLLALAWLSLLAMPSIVLGRYAQWAWVGTVVAVVASALCAFVAWSQVRSEGVTAIGLFTAAPYTLHTVVGAYVAAAFLGLQPTSVDAGIYWQLESMLVNLLIAMALGMRLVQQFQQTQQHQAQLVSSLAQSEQALEDRVRQRTEELLETHNALQAALHSERELRQGQRQFFNMVNHEFRTPLAVVDSAATEQLTFPSPDLPAQVERATQIRRACRRLTALVDNCLVSERLDAAGFALHPSAAPVVSLLQEAAQLVQWSSRHQLHLITHQAPVSWVCDATLVRIALSNLVDNAVKYAQAGGIYITARQATSGNLELAVADEGPGLSPAAVQRIFEQFERGQQSDRTPGFGLGLWLARRVARMHGGDVSVQSTPGLGTCFTLTLPQHAPTGAASSPFPRAMALP